MGEEHFGKWRMVWEVDWAWEVVGIGHSSASHNPVPGMSQPFAGCLDLCHNGLDSYMWQGEKYPLTLNCPPATFYLLLDTVRALGIGCPFYIGSVFFWKIF